MPIHGFEADHNILLNPISSTIAVDNTLSVNKFESKEVELALLPI